MITQENVMCKMQNSDHLNTIAWNISTNCWKRNVLHILRKRWDINKSSWKLHRTACSLNFRSWTMGSQWRSLTQAYFHLLYKSFGFRMPAVALIIRKFDFTPKFVEKMSQSIFFTKMRKLSIINFYLYS